MQAEVLGSHKLDGYIIFMLNNIFVKFGRAKNCVVGMIVKSSNGVFVPVQPSPLDLMATLPFLQIARDERKKPLIILNRVMPRARLTDAMILRLRYSGAKIARSRISSKVIFAETFAVGRGVIDINVTSDASKEIINVGNEIIRNL